MKKILFIILLLSIKQVNAQTNVSGGIYSNTTWFKANSPYIIMDTVVVFPGVTLTIQAGVTVKFANTQRLEIRQAKLIAVGTAVDSITFTSNSLSPTPGIYSGIYLNGGSMSSQFRYCNLKYSDAGLQNLTSGYGFKIKNCKITFNVDGIFGGGLGNNSVLDSSIVENNIGVAIGEFDTIKNCSISKNYQGVADGFTIINCVVDSNSFIGIWENTGSILNCSIRYNGKGIYWGNPLKINNCIITHNKTGIEPAAHQTITNCIIDSNDIGIDNGSMTNAAYNYISNCHIQYNDTGIVDYGSHGNGSNTFTKNIIGNNTLGILLGVTIDSFYCNTICNNSSYGLKYLLNSNTNCVTKNYWCVPDSASTEVVIYDGYDNVNYGLVAFMPIDSICSPINTTSIKSNNFNTGFNIYPNPTSHQFIIESNTTDKLILDLYDVNGRLVFSKNIIGKTILDVSTFNEGVYNLSIKTAGSVTNKKLVIVR